jgi:hypothetical protein
MKTPREILLAQHRAAIPKLDAVRQSAIAAVTGAQQPRPAVRTNLFQMLWRELILPSRRTWAGLATVWVLLIAVNLVLRDQSPATGAKPVTIAAMINYGEQQKFLNELFADRSPAIDADRPKVFSPKPRTEAFRFLTA